MDAVDSPLSEFAIGTPARRWDAARQLMANRALISVLTTQEFQVGFANLTGDAAHTEGLDRLLSIDLLVRLSSFAKKLVPTAVDALTRGLTTPLPPLLLAAESSDLPNDAKPAEIRENVAQALAHASGSWVEPYILRSLAEEDRSQRCRTELVRQLVRRNPRVAGWLRALAAVRWSFLIEGEQALAQKAQRCRDLSQSLVDALRAARRAVVVDAEAPVALDEFVRALLVVPTSAALPKRLDEAASAIVTLLDELLLTNLTLITEPDAYTILGRVRNWFHPRPFPRTTAAALSTIVAKLETAIVLRGRMGQRSDALLARLSQAMGSREAAEQRLKELAASELALDPDVADWLLGIKRDHGSVGENLVAKLRAISSDDVAQSIADLLLEAHEASQILELVSDTEARQLGTRLCEKVMALSVEQHLYVAGRVGDVVEFNPLAHRTETGELPGEHRVVLVRPAVMRARPDRGHEVVVKALVSNAE